MDFGSKPSPFSSFKLAVCRRPLTHRDLQRLAWTSLNFLNPKHSHSLSLIDYQKVCLTYEHCSSFQSVSKVRGIFFPSFTTYFKGVFLKSLRNDSLFCVKVFDSKSCQKRSFLRFEIAKSSSKFSVSLALQFSVSRSFLKLSKKRNVLNVSD